MTIANRLVTRARGERGRALACSLQSISRVPTLQSAGHGGSPRRCESSEKPLSNVSGQHCILERTRTLVAKIKRDITLKTASSTLSATT